MKLLLVLLVCLWMMPVYPVYAQEKGIYKDVKVSWYGEAICRGRKLCKTASGKIFQPNKEFTTACWGEFPFYTVFRVTYNDRSVMVTCTDRGGFKKMNRFLDLSSSAFKELAPLSRGVLKVDVEVIK